MPLPNDELQPGRQNNPAGQGKQAAEDDDSEKVPEEQNVQNMLKPLPAVE